MHRTKLTGPSAIAVLIFWSALTAAAAPLGTAFTYQGRLAAGGAPANGLFDLRLTLYDQSTAGNVAGPVLTIAAVAVSNGLFTTTVDFGANLFTGATYWMEVAIQTSGSNEGYSPLLPRQPLTATPYALFAPNAGLAATATVANAVAPLSVTDASVQNLTLTAGKVASGQLVKSVNGLTDAVRIVAGNNVTLSTNGNDLQIASGTGNDWRLGGNAGTVPGTDFLGTADNTALELKVNGQRALRLEPSAIGPNLIGGNKGNFVAPGAVGATIAGGGTTSLTNRATATLATVGGGGGNSATAIRATVAGGEANTADAAYAAVGGGNQNAVSGTSNGGVIAGGVNNSVYYSAFASIAGGELNSIGSNSVGAVVGGGRNNFISAESAGATIAGGKGNGILPEADWSTVAGGSNNMVAAGAPFATIPGGRDNLVAGAYAFAAGRRAQAIHDGSFVWADAGDADFVSTSTNQFLIRARAGVGIGTAAPAMALDVFDGSGNNGSGGNIHVGGTGNGASNGDPKLIHFGDLQPGTNLGYVYLGENGTDDTMELYASKFYFNKGNIGIQTNNPQSTLDVRGTANVASTLTVGGTTRIGGSLNVSGTANLSNVLSLARTTVSNPGTNQIGVGSSYVRLSSSVSTTNTIANGTAIGALLILEGTSDSAKITIPNTSNTRLAGGVTKVLGSNDTLMLIWNGTAWLQLSSSDN